MLNAERQLAYDPSNIELMRAFKDTASRAGFERVAGWVADVLHGAATEPD
jgi:hypothetical protein